MNKPFLAAALFTLAADFPALAQSGPRVDCDKAPNKIERAVCEDPNLAAADRKVAAAYAALVTRLTGSARAHLLNDQRRWLDNRTDCGLDLHDPGECLESRYAERMKHLEAFGAGSYPFVSTHRIYRTTRPDDKVAYSIDISYPQFDGETADFAALNRRFAADAGEVVDRLSSDGFGSSWSYGQGFVVIRPGANAITIASVFSSARGRYDDGTFCTLVDLSTGRAVGPEDVFRTGDQWLTLMVEIVSAHLKELFGENQNFDEVRAPANLAKPLRDAEHYCYRSDKLELIFNRGVIASPFAGGGAFSIDIPYARLRPLLRADGPLGKK